MGETFDADRLAPTARRVFDSAQARLQFHADVFWARAYLGDELLGRWLETYQLSRDFRKRGIVELELR